MFINNTPYRQQRNGLAKSSPCAIAMAGIVYSFNYHLPKAFIQSSKDFIY
ncbi:hypothetical protein [Mucilaginibacter aquariorum]|uniref:Uncharacterized protein n=1 Tax=Mucilaginibacter aquariorum TaxID=2967225 RepID=A0ABT1T1A5_9SPHI|nr:hypothetical protein [Mucilaginibacter aquariorum]MCQ6958376.1 hypothetical protein [Mucilaginibacter aquariorum]